MPLKVPMLFPGVPFGKQAVVCAKTLRTLLKILATKPSTLASMPSTAQKKANPSPASLKPARMQNGYEVRMIRCEVMQLVGLTCMSLNLKRVAPSRSHLKI